MYYPSNEIYYDDYNTKQKLAYGVSYLNTPYRATSFESPVEVKNYEILNTFSKIKENFDEDNFHKLSYKISLVQLLFIVFIFLFDKTFGHYISKSNIWINIFLLCIILAIILYILIKEL